MPLQEWLTRPDAAKLLELSASRLNALADEGPGFMIERRGKTGGFARYRRAWVYRYAVERRTGVRDPHLPRGCVWTRQDVSWIGRFGGFWVERLDVYENWAEAADLAEELWLQPPTGDVILGDQGAYPVDASHFARFRREGRIRRA